MARKAGFHVYTLRVKEAHKREFQTLDSINDEHDLLEIFNAGMRAEIAAHKNDPAAERMACLKRVVRNGRSISGLFTAGNYGEAADIVSSINAAVSYEKKTTDAEMLPCFFRIEIPTDRDEAILILQRDNRVSSKAAFLALASSILMDTDPDLKLKLIPLVSREEFDKLIDAGAVQSLRFIKMSITDDLADSYDTGHQEVEGSVEYTVKARKGKSLPFKDLLKRWSRATNSVKDTFELEALDFDTVKAEVRIGRRTQTVDFGKKLNTPIIDLSAQVRFGTDGHPTFASLVDATSGLAEDYLEVMYG